MSLLESPTAKFEERNQLTHMYSDPMSTISNSSSVSDNFTILLNQAKEKKAIHEEAKTIQQELFNERKIHDQEKEEILHKLEQVVAEKNTLYSFINSLIDILNIPKIESSNEVETTTFMNHTSSLYDFDSILSKIEQIIREYTLLKKIKKKLLNETSSQTIEEALNDIAQLKKQGEIISGFSDLKKIIHGQSELIQTVLTRVQQNGDEEIPQNHSSENDKHPRKDKADAITSPIKNKGFDYSGNDYSSEHREYQTKKSKSHNKQKLERKQSDKQLKENSRYEHKPNQRTFHDFHSSDGYDSNEQNQVRKRFNQLDKEQINYSDRENEHYQTKYRYNNQRDNYNNPKQYESNSNHDSYGERQNRYYDQNEIHDEKRSCQQQRFFDQNLDGYHSKNYNNERNREGFIQNQYQSDHRDTNFDAANSNYYQERCDYQNHDDYGKRDGHFTQQRCNYYHRETNYNHQNPNYQRDIDSNQQFYNDEQRGSNYHEQHTNSYQIDNNYNQQKPNYDPRYIDSNQRLNNDEQRRVNYNEHRNNSYQIDNNYAQKKQNYDPRYNDSNQRLNNDEQRRVNYNEHRNNSDQIKCNYDQHSRNNDQRDGQYDDIRNSQSDTRLTNASIEKQNSKEQRIINSRQNDNVSHANSKEQINSYYEEQSNNRKVNLDVKQSTRQSHDDTHDASNVTPNEFNDKQKNNYQPIDKQDSNSMPSSSNDIHRMTNSIHNSNEEESVDMNKKHSEKSYNDVNIQNEVMKGSTCNKVEKKSKRKKKHSHQSNEQNVIFVKNSSNCCRHFNIASEVDNTTSEESCTNGYNDMKETIWMTKTRDLLSLERQLMKRTKQLNKAKKEQFLLQTKYQKELRLIPETLF